MGQFEVEDEVKDDLKRASGEFTMDRDQLESVTLFMLKHMQHCITMTLSSTFQLTIEQNQGDPAEYFWS